MTATGLCALKVMLPSLVKEPSLRARFQLEATIAAEIDSEHIVQVFDAGVDAATGMPFIVMELLKGEEIGSLLQRQLRLSPGEVVPLVHQAALALAKTHAAGIIHRDLKPENLFVTTRDDGSPRLKVLDFGIAKVIAESTHGAQQTGTMGTPLYMSPEQIQGQGSISPRADLYAMGHVVFAMLVGEPTLLQRASGSLSQAASCSAPRSSTTSPTRSGPRRSSRSWSAPRSLAERHRLMRRSNWWASVSKRPCRGPLGGPRRPAPRPPPA
jgi:serine/threonine protein kinase